MIEVLLTFQLPPHMKHIVFFELIWSAFVNSQTAQEAWVQVLINRLHWSL